jgi:hypothetical protein
MGKINGSERKEDFVSKTIQKRQSKNMKLLLENLRKVPIIQIACEKSGISRATYYRWRAYNTVFAKQADKAINESVELINDMAEAKLIGSIKEGNMGAIVYWLKHRHKAYSNRIEVMGTLERSDGEISEEYKELIDKALRIALPRGKETMNGE